MKEALIKLDSVLNIFHFKYDKIHVCWGISNKIKDLHIKKIYKDECIEFDTNVGIESIDIINGSEHLYSKTDLVKLKKFFKDKNSNIIVRVE